MVALDRIYGLKLFHPKYATETKQDKFVTKEKRGRKSKKAYGKAIFFNIFLIFFKIITQ